MEEIDMNERVQRMVIILDNRNNLEIKDKFRPV